MLKLDRVDEKQIHRAFREAFADYAMDASGVSEESLRIRAIKNGVDFDVSVGAYDGERMVGFTLIGLANWKGEAAAFDAGTGIMPAFRGQGLAQRMFDHSLPALRRRGVRRFLLEVLQSNEAAIHAYEKAGFAITREFICLSLERGKLPGAPTIAADLSIAPVDKAAVLAFEGQCDWTPSWENSFTAIERLPENLDLYGAYSGSHCVGVIAYSPTFRWILSLIVRRDQRRRGVATALIRHLHDRLPDDLEIISITNVDAGDPIMLACLERNGFEHWVDQYEMELIL